MSANHDNADKLLANVPLFAGLVERDLRRISGLMTGLEVPAGKVITREGQTGREFIIILEGTASVTVDGDQVAAVGPGDFQGEISLLDGGPRTATVVATSPMRLLVASGQEFDQLLDEAPTIARKMLPALAHRIRSLSDSAHTH